MCDRAFEGVNETSACLALNDHLDRNCPGEPARSKTAGGKPKPTTVSISDDDDDDNVGELDDDEVVEHVARSEPMVRVAVSTAAP